jgi:hypothetical protein
VILEHRTRRIFRSQHGKPVFVHHFPAAIKGFYFEVDKDDPKYALGIDLLAPEGYGEIIGGGERAASLEYLEAQLKHHGLDQATFEWYLDLRRYGSVPTPASAWASNAAPPGGQCRHRYCGTIRGDHSVSERVLYRCAQRPCPQMFSVVLSFCLVRDIQLNCCLPVVFTTVYYKPKIISSTASEKRNRCRSLEPAIRRDLDLGTARSRSSNRF